LTSACNPRRAGCATAELLPSHPPAGFLVLTRQNEYADSRRREVVAHLDLNKAVARLRQALGATLGAHGIRVE